MSKTNRIFLAFLSAVSLLAPRQAIAHGQYGHEFRTGLEASAALTYRSADLAEEVDDYRISGALMGGESYREEQGLNLSSAHLTGFYQPQKDIQVAASLAVHSHDDNYEIELDKALISWQPALTKGIFLIEAGMMSTLTTDSASRHADTDLVAEPSLVSDVLWGRHHRDLGLRATYLLGGWTVGVEAWNGDGWPAADRANAFSGYLAYNIALWGGNLSNRAWLFRADAEDREDDRFDPGHNHSDDLEDLELPAFTGHTQLVGWDLDWKKDLQTGSLQISMRLTRSQSEGDLTLTGQAFPYENAYTAGLVLGAYRYEANTFYVRAEQIELDNDFNADITATQIEAMGLTGNYEPWKGLLGWQRQTGDQFAIRLEAVVSRHQAGSTEKALNLGVIWQSPLL